MKYYTPTIEEFHIGFECEIRTPEGWEPFLIKTPHHIQQANILLHELDMRGPLNRVKYLDEQDLQELGWEEVGELEWEKGTFVLTNTHFDLQPDNWMLMRSYDFEGDKMLLGIKINNKSELRKLMQMLGI